MSITVSQILLPTNILTGSSSNLVPSKNMVRNFGNPEDYVELHISDPIGSIIYSIVPFKGYTVPGTFKAEEETTFQSLIFNPEQDSKNFGLTNGNYNLYYNILRPKIVLDNNRSFFIKEISPDRTELRLLNNNISKTDLELNVSDFIDEIKNSPYFKEFYINFGRNQLFPAVNIIYDPGTLDANVRPASVLIKLLNPLPLIYTVNSSLNIVDKISNSQAFSVNIITDPVPVVFPTLRGPNFDLDLDNLRVGPTPYYNFNQVTTFNGSFAPQLQQLLGQLSASNFAINIDYNGLEYENWVHFSSAARRLEGFQYKLETIEANNEAIYSASISNFPISQLDVQLYQNKIDNVIQSFDGWEQHMFYESGSYAWPKQNSSKPYINYSITSSQAINWYNGNYASASLYDDNNQNYLLYAMPGYITENDSNELAFKFVASMGQMFDDIWIHIKAITDLYKAKNALNQGISKDIVYFALQSMGIDVYTDQDGTNIFQYLYGVSEDGSYKPITGSYETLISASNYQLSGQDQQKGIYKRLYHNLPLLLKSKGTNRFNQYLNTIFGVPSTIMGQIEYGGVDKLTSSFEYEYDRFTYSIESTTGANIDVPWVYISQSFNRTGFNDIVPNGIEFRFKAVPSSSNHDLTDYTPQTLLNGPGFSLDLKYIGVGSPGTIYEDIEGDFGYFEFNIDGTSVSTSALPVFNTGSDGDTSWYNILIQRRYPDRRIGQVGFPQIYDIYIKNNIFGEVGHVVSASLSNLVNSGWYTAGGNITLGNGTTGSYQELRLWSNYISESVFDSHVLNPESIEGNFTTSSYQDLAARFTLGNNLYTYNHNSVTTANSSAPDQYVQRFTASFSGFPNRNNYHNFVETYYADVANSGYSNPVTDKIRIYSGSEYGTQLMPNKSIEVEPIIPITKDIHLLDASLSPQDEIDRAIIAAFGSTYSVDEIIGNPAVGSYKQFQSLQVDFFKKFTTKYNYKDYIRLIEFFHNSLFRTLKDFTPARTNLATGIVIKPHLLERPVIYRSEPTFTHLDISASIDTAFISGSNGGDYSQSLYPLTYNTLIGKVNATSDARDFFTGELPSASIAAVEPQENPFVVFKQDNLTGYSESIWYHDYNPLLNNIPSSRLSTTRKKSEYINSGSNFVQVLSTASLQDFYYDYQRHIRPRYIGSKATSNEYTFFNTNVDGDLNFIAAGVGSYGKSAAIDKNTIQFAFFSEATCTGSFQIAFPELTNVYIKYLIDENSNTIELSTKRYNEIKDQEFWNLYQVQNIFKDDEIANISLFDAQQPDLQKELDGNKRIHFGGFKLYPTLWRIYQSKLVYAKPDGASSQDQLNPTKYTTSIPTVGRVGFFLKSVVKGNITYTLPPLPYDVEINLEILYGKKKEKTYINVSMPKNIIVGGVSVSNNTSSYRVEIPGWPDVDTIAVKVISIKPTTGADPNVSFSSTDFYPWLTIDNNDKRIVTCSKKISNLYDPAPERYGDTSLFFSASLTDSTYGTAINNYLNANNSLLKPEFSFTINPGDVVRFDPPSSTTITYNFNEINEYTIISVNTTGSFSDGSAMVTFTLDKEIANNVIDTTTIPGQKLIQKYIFARKIPDETNIIVHHRKQPGITSSGIVKNRNLSLHVDEKVANIVGELKSKLFSTVLIP